VLFVCRLITRPDFSTTMTDTERAVMSEHFVYWRGQLERGTILLFGPVLDPTGVWGLAIARADDADEVASMTAADPVVVAGLGRYETHPMAPGSLSVT
jgi:uncharacterized protein